MTTIRNIFQRINAIMKEVKYVQKSDKKVNNQYSFVSHDAVSSALQPHLVEHGVVIVPSVTNLIEEGNRTTVQMCISFVNIDNPSDMISITSYGYGIDSQDKGIGKAVSYATKYAMLKMFCLETGDDPEKDLIEADKAPAHDPILVKTKKQFIYKTLSTHKPEDVDLWISALANTHKKTIEFMTMRIHSPEDIIEQYTTWHEKQYGKA